MRSGISPGIELALLLLAGGPAWAAEPSAADAAFFEKEVRPLLAEKCWGCHGEDRAKGGLKLTTRAHLLRGGGRGPAAEAGKPKDSLLLRAVRYQDEPRMPPRGKLTDRQIAALERWVKLGLPWPGAEPSPPAITEEQRRFWSFQPVKRPPVPAVHDAAWPRSAVDRFILAGLEAKGLSPAAPADKRTLLRRATFDLTGLPPTPEEMDAFLADDSPEAFARVVDRLLASPRYGERWGRHWLDVVRYADARDLIQLPPASDFREAWRYRDWVVRAFNRDLPYTEFIRAQLAGDLLPPPRPGGINKDGLVATGLLAIADFVPGDVDKEQMIADCVNDQIDVVGRAFLGLSLACARCHDHKFDPIPTEDYYALAGIFFSSRIIPGPVPGNTPLVRVPLLSADEIAAARAKAASDGRRRAELERQLLDAPHREYLDHLRRLVPAQTARYLVAACEYRKGPAKPALGELAKRHGLHEGLLAGWVAYLDRIEKEPAAACHPAVRDAAAGRLTGAALERSAEKLQRSLAAQAERARDPRALARDALILLRADDPRLATDAASRVTLWPNRADLPADARPPAGATGPVKASATIGGNSKPVLRFDGRSGLQAPRRVPPAGSLFVVFRTADAANAGQRLVGWEDSSVGRHGLGLIADPGGHLHAVLRNDGRSGDLPDTRRVEGFEIVCITWGPHGTTLHRGGAAAGAGKGIDAVSSDPAITGLQIGGPGSGGSPRFRGDVAEIRVYARPLNDAERRRVEAELRDTWFRPADPKAPPPDPVAELYEELLSSRGPFWLSAGERAKLLPANFPSRLDALKHELDGLRKKPAPEEIPQAVAVQDGGPPGTRHEGFKDAQVFLRGDHKKLGKMVPRGFPRVLAGERPPRITNGSGRLQLADWLASAENPLVARVMVNRIWQHHFGEGLVRTPNDFGRRGERPTHPELLDYLAAYFVESGWSVKAMHRLIMLSSAYRQGSRAGAALARDPENRLLGRMNRRPLEAEAVRDSLLAVAGRLDGTSGGPPFKDLAVPRRTLYLLSARTGANTSDFGRLFDRADPGSIVDRRGQSVVAPQALFFLNDPFVSAAARNLASRLAREVPAGGEARIRRLYALALGRPPTRAELDLGLGLLTPDGDADPWARYCQVILCTNEFVYLD